MRRDFTRRACNCDSNVGLHKTQQEPHGAAAKPHGELRKSGVWKLRGPEAALEMIDPLKSELSGYFYFHGLRGVLLKQLNRLDDARDALNRAIALATSVAEANHIRRELDRLTLD